MANREFDVDWPLGHETMAGDPVRIVARDLRGPYQLAVVVTDKDTGEDSVEAYRADGVYLPGSDGFCDLRNCKPLA